MDLKGAEVRNFYKLTNKMGNGEESIDKVQIPHYQRPYKWNENLVSQLIQDWSSENKKNQGSEYFAGSIVTVINESNVDSKHQLIDGQQRFTTIFLTNFLLFLILRVLLREAIRGKQQLHIPKLLEQLEIAIKFSVNNKIEEVLNLEKIQEAFENADTDDGASVESLLEKYCDVVFLPNKPESSSNYSELYISKLKEYILKHELRLSYDRESYNGSLIRALSGVVLTCDSQHPLSLKINQEYFKEGGVEKVYLEAIRTIFDNFKEINRDCSNIEEQGIFKFSLSIKDLIIKFLSGVKLCVIQTGNQEDAYTLFEVLNDRSLALDDLDLIKNQFYKCLCISSKNTGMDNDELDKHISIREEQWGDKVFKNNSETNKKLIAYLASSYITGSTSIGLKAHDKFRDAIKSYLNSYNEKYSSENIEKDFNIFQTIKIFVDIFQMAANNRVLKALEAEFSDKTITYKTVHLLLALGFEGVLAGLTNFILQYIKLETKNDKFDLSEVELTISELASDTDKHKKVHDQAKSIWQLVLVSSDYMKPRKLANILIENNCNINNHNNRPISQQEIITKEQFEYWLNPWRYNSSDVKVKILFARLLQLDISDGKLKKSTFSFSINKDNINRLHLDHMEPSKPEISTPKAYYKFGKIERDDDVNALGNMFPLPGNENISKSNKPMYTVFSYLSDSGLKNHWLTLKTKEHFESNCSNENGIKVPTQQFFTERKEYLIQKFYEAITM